MAKPDLGGKHKCPNCGTKFFDLNKDPITCPKCGTVAQGAPALAARASRATDEDEEETEAEAGPEVVSLEDADATEDGKVTAAQPEEDVDVEEEEAGSEDDDTFLEEDEEDGGDVSDLIDGDIEDEEER